MWLRTGKNDLRKKEEKDDAPCCLVNVWAGLMQKSLSKALCAQKTAQNMIGLEGRVKKKKRGRKGAVYMAVPQNIPHFRLRRCTRYDPKITRYKNSRIRVGKYDKSAYDVFFTYFLSTLSCANKLVYAVNDAEGLCDKSSTTELH